MPVLTKINTNVIADDAITAAKTAPSAEEESGGLGLSTAAAGNLTGTISTQQLQLADAFTLTGDLTVNDDLILGKVRDDGTGQSITGSGKTLTGTGTLTMGSYLEEPLRAEKLGGNFTPAVYAEAANFDSAFNWVTSGHGTNADAICDIGKLRLMRFTGTSGGSASDWGSSYAGTSRYYINLSITFGYTFSSIPMAIWHWGLWDSHHPVITTTNTSTTTASAYTHAYQASNLESKAFTVLVVGEN